MDLLKSILMGLVQGLAEFLPISSSGHLAIMKQVLNIDMDTGLLFDVMLHFGTMVAIFIVFWKDIMELITEGFKIIGDSLVNTFRFIHNLFLKEKLTYKKVISTPYRRFVMLVIVSTIPTGIIGVVFNNAIEEAGKTLLVPGLSLIFTALLLTIADRVHTGHKTEENASFKNAGILGLAQGLATLPGISRSGTTITVGLLSGFDRSFAVKYSFIMSIPAVLGAVVYEMKDFSMELVNKSELTGYIAGTVVAAVVGYISIKTMLVIVRGKKFKYFAYYCYAIGLVALAGYFFL